MEPQALTDNTDLGEFENLNHKIAHRALCEQVVAQTQNISGAPKQTHSPTSSRANKWCSDYINLPLRHRSFGKFNPYA